MVTENMADEILTNCRLYSKDQASALQGFRCGAGLREGGWGCDRDRPVEGARFEIRDSGASLNRNDAVELSWKVERPPVGQASSLSRMTER